MAHFEMQILAPDGTPQGEMIYCKTAVGVIMQCPNSMDKRDIEHLCALAVTTPDYPIDVTAWTGPEGARYMTWSARLYYRKAMI